MAESKGKPREASEQTEAGDPADEDAALREKNEKVLHTRIPQSLEREIKKRARNMGISVSTVVRNVLLHTFDLVEDIVTDSTNLALSIAGQETRPSDHENRSPRSVDRHSPDTEVLGWQEAILNLNAVCDRCNAILEKGTTAAIGIRESPGRRTIICTKCLGAVTGDGPARSSRSR